MDKVLITIITVFTMAVSVAQDGVIEETNSQKRMTSFSDLKRHEISLDVISALTFPAFNPRYEYVLSKYSGVGVDVNINFDNENDTDYLERFSITPFYRQYFFSKEDYGAKGFYAEGFLKAHTYREEVFTSFNGASREIDESFFDMAIGVGIGWKWISKSGFLADLHLGLGRNLGFENDPFVDREFTGRGGINFGWRF